METRAPLNVPSAEFLGLDSPSNGAVISTQKLLGFAMALGEASPEGVPPAHFSSTRGGGDVVSYEYALSHAQPDNKGLWYREPFKQRVLSDAQQTAFIVFLGGVLIKRDEKIREKLRRVASDDNSPNSDELSIEQDNAEIRKVVKVLFRFLWTQMGTGLSGEEIEEVVNSLDSFQSPFIVPVEAVGASGIYLVNETTGPTDAFKDLALQQVTTMVSVIAKRKNIQAVRKALEEKKAGTQYKFVMEDGEEKLVKYELQDGKMLRAEEQGNRPKISIVMTQTSTSGDTGPAGGAGIEGREFVANIIGFPAFEATLGQIGQMTKLSGNVLSIAFKEAFTKIQESMKSCNTAEFKAQLQERIEKAFRSLREEYGFDIEVSSGSFNSVNIGRVDAQSIYHSAVLLLAKAACPGIYGNVVEAIPSGNFGHGTSVTQAKDMMGGVEDIIVSTNPNDAIGQLIRTGHYVMATSEVSSPSVSMIIRYGSNVERVLRRITTPERTAELMSKFELDGKILEAGEKYLFAENVNIDEFHRVIDPLLDHYQTLPASLSWSEPGMDSSVQLGVDLIPLFKDAHVDSIRDAYIQFKAKVAGIQLTSDEHTRLKALGLQTYRVEIADELNTMREVWMKYDRLICPHTANAFHAAEKYLKAQEEEEKQTKFPVLVSETASPWKFLAAVATALTCENKDEMPTKYEELRKQENTSEGARELLRMIAGAYERNGKEFNENMIPEDLREIYEQGVELGKIHDSLEFGELTLDFAELQGPRFVGQLEKLIVKELGLAKKA